MTEQDMIIQDLRRENENLRAELEWKQKEIELARRHARQWISVEDRLPEQGEEAICIAADGDMMIGKYTEWGWMFPCYFEELTHWMPIPQPPKEVEE